MTKAEVLEELRKRWQEEGVPFNEQLFNDAYDLCEAARRGELIEHKQIKAKSRQRQRYDGSKNYGSKLYLALHV